MTDDLEDLPPPKLEYGDLTGTPVVVLTDEGAVRRGRRRWHPGRTVGQVLSKHRLHDRAWNVRVNEYTVILFTDELTLVLAEEAAS